MDMERSQRMERLSAIVMDGQEAEIVKKYADRWLAEVESEVLQKLLVDSSDPQELQYYYQACSSFRQSIEHAVQAGQRKQDKLSAMIKGD